MVEMTKQQLEHAERVIAKEIAKCKLPGNTAFEHRNENVVIFYSYFYQKYVSVEVAVHDDSKE